MSIVTCKSCGNKLNPRDGVCPVYGKVTWQMHLSAEAKGMPMLRARHKVPGFKRFHVSLKSGEKISGETKRPTREYLVIDKEKCRKLHHVEERDESGQWTTLHHEDEPLGPREE